MGYSSLEGAWPYQEVQEVALGQIGEAVLWMLALPGVLFAMGLFFLIAGLLTPGPIARKGPQSFARDQLVRLGVPLVVWVFALWPASMAVMHQATGDSRSYWWELVHAEPVLDTGPMWFVAVLLIYSLGYAGGAHATRRSRQRLLPCPAVVLDRWRGHWSHSPSRSRSPRSSYVSSSPSPAARSASRTYGSVRNTWDCSAWASWPLAAAGSTPCPDPIRRGCGAAAVLSVMGFVVLGASVAAAGLQPDVFTDLRMHWAPLGLAALEGPLAVGASVWLLALAQRRLDRPAGRRARALARSA